MSDRERTRRWIDLLAEEDLAFIQRFLLASGSLKDLAAAYGVSYPTVRLRMDRLIEKIKVIISHDTEDDFERTLRGLYAEGRLEAGTFKTLLATYQKQRAQQSTHHHPE